MDFAQIAFTRIHACATRRWIAAWFFLLAAVQGSYALSPGVPLTQFSHEQWQTKKGLPQNSVNCVVQDQTGFLWLGTDNGLVRFDGFRFQVFDNENTLALTHNFISRLLSASDGKILGGTLGGGVLIYDGSTFTTFTTNNGLSDDQVWSLAETPDGSIWIGTRFGLNRLSGDRLTVFHKEDGLPHEHVTALHVTPTGALWIGTAAGGLARFEDETFSAINDPQIVLTSEIRAIVSHGNVIFIGCDGDGLFEWNDGKIEKARLSTDAQAASVQSLFSDSSGTLWIGTQHDGLLRYSEGVTTEFTMKEGLSSHHVTSLLVDREGSLWIGTGYGGLNRLREGAFRTFIAREGLANEKVTCLYEGQDQLLWAGTIDGGIYQYRGDQFRRLHLGLGATNHIRTLLVTQDNTLWIGTAGAGLGKYKTGIATFRVGADQGIPFEITALFEDRKGRIWIGSQQNGVFVHDPKSGMFHSASKPVASFPPVRTIAQDNTGTIWIGTEQGAITSTPNHIDLAEVTAFRNVPVLCFYFDEMNTLWAGTMDQGMVRYREGKATFFNTYNGFKQNQVSHILEENGHLWFSGSQGIGRVEKRALEGAKEGTISQFNIRNFNELDGLRTTDCSGGFNPAGFKTKDGSLWFATKRGAATINPARFAANSTAPPVVIHGLLADGHRLELGGDVRLPAGTTRLEIHYSALSLKVPSRVQFCYKLSDVDKNWVDVYDHQAVYHHLKPGTYKFDLQACNEEGVWNEAGTSLAFTVKPFFYQTWWFYSLAGIAALALGTTTYRWHLRGVSQRAAALERLVADRTLDIKKEVEQRKIAEQNLLRVNDDLEERVTLRTAELRRAYHDLETELNERRRIETALLKSEAKFRRVVESGMVGVLFWEKGGKILDANQTFLSMVGYTRDELLKGKIRWDRITPPEFLSRDEVALQEISLTGLCTPFEKEYIHAEGHRVPVLLGAASYEDQRDSGVCFVIDISRRKQVEEQVRKLNQTLEARVTARTAELAEANLHLQSEIQERRRVADALKAFSNLGHALQSAHTEREAALVIAEAARQLLKYDQCSIELFGTRGTLYPVLNSPEGLELNGGSAISVPIRNGVRVVGSLTLKSALPDAFDTNETGTLEALGDYCGGALDRIHAEQARHDSERRFSAFMSHAPVLAWMKNSRFEYVFTNHSFQQLLHSTADQLENKSDYDLWSETIAARIRAHDLEVAASGKTLETAEVLPGHDGEKRTFLTLRFPFSTATGDQFVAGMAIDVTEQRRAEDALHKLPQSILEAQERERRRVARELHDSVNQAIASIKFRVQTAEQQITRGDPRWLETWGKTKEMLDSVLNQVRRISRNLRPSELDDFGLLSAIRTTCQEFQARTGLDLEVVCPDMEDRFPSPLEISLYRITQEALTNIEKHSGATSARVHLRNEDGYVTLQISDNGQGFRSPEHRNGDSGLGLLHMRERASFVGGVFTAKTEPGAGVTLTIHAPITGSVATSNG